MEYNIIRLKFVVCICPCLLSTVHIAFNGTETLATAYISISTKYYIRYIICIPTRDRPRRNKISITARYLLMYRGSRCVWCRLWCYNVIIITVKFIVLYCLRRSSSITRHCYWILFLPFFTHNITIYRI